MENTIKDFKKVCLKIGIVMSVFFASGIVCSLLVNYIEVNFSEELGVSGTYILRLTLTGVFLYGIPILSMMIVLGKLTFSSLYKKPPRLAKAIDNFPALYGLGQLTNFIALLIVSLIANFRVNEGTVEDLERSFGSMNSLLPPNLLCGMVLFIYMVFAAGVFEELMCRGFLLNALKPFGNGFAIIITGFLFGIMHGNFHQFSYSFILGIVLAYITIQTGSILTSTILHAMFNSVAAVMMVFLSTDTLKDRIFGIMEGVMPEVTDKSTMVWAMFGIYFAFFIGLLVIGVALALKKLTKIRTYKIINPAEIEITSSKRTAIFFTTVTVIIMLLLTVDRFAGGFVAGLVKDLW